MKKSVLFLTAAVCVQLSSAFWIGPGVVDGAYVFKDVSKENQGKSDHFPLFQSIELEGDFGISFWVMLTEGISGEDVVIGTTGGGNRVDFEGGRVRLFNGNSTVVQAATGMVTETWIHVAFTRSGNSVTLYFDGDEEAAGEWSGTFAFSHLAGNGTDNERVLGKLDDIRIYSRALTVAEVGHLRASHLAEASLATGLDHHWPLDDMQEYFNRDAINGDFPFSSHWMGILDTIVSFNGNSAFADMDKDGDLDFVSGRVRQGDVNNNNMYWWEYVGPDEWNMHLVGEGQSTVASGEAADVNRDGWPDIIAGKEWYENPRNERTTSWTMHRDVFGDRTEDVNMGDVDGDGYMEFFFLWGNGYLYKMADDPTDPAIVLGEFTDGLKKNEGGTFGDVDGDGDVDIVRGDLSWLENANGEGSQWNVVPLLGQAFAGRVMSAVGDLDEDGDLDVALVKHFGTDAAWVENVDGAGTEWNLTVIGSGKQNFHNMAVADFNNDGHLDIFGGENMGQNYVWEGDGKGNFTEHIVSVTARGHTARVGDVDCDGDLDIAGKPWEGGNHVYHRNLTVERGGTPIFHVDRGPYEGGFNQGIDCREFLTDVIRINESGLGISLRTSWVQSMGLHKTIRVKTGMVGAYRLSILTLDGKALRVIEGGADQFGFTSAGKGPWVLRVGDGNQSVERVIRAR